MEDSLKLKGGVLREAMKKIQNTVFIESKGQPIWSWKNAHTRRLTAQRREKIREQAEAFINEIGVERVVSVTEHAPSLGPFSVVVWW